MQHRWQRQRQHDQPDAPACQSRQSRANRRGMTMSMNAMAPPICSCYLPLSRADAMSRSPTAIPRWTTRRSSRRCQANTSQARRIVLVQDNLSTHKPASLYEAFPPDEARRLVERFEWHETPRHGNWLDMAESELSVLSGQCLDRRIPEQVNAGQRSRRLAERPQQAPFQGGLAVHHRRCPGSSSSCYTRATSDSGR